MSPSNSHFLPSLDVCICSNIPGYYDPLWGLKNFRKSATKNSVANNPISPLSSLAELPFRKRANSFDNLAVLNDRSTLSQHELEEAPVPRTQSAEGFKDMPPSAAMPRSKSQRSLQVLHRSASCDEESFLNGLQSNTPHNNARAHKTSSNSSSTPVSSTQQRVSVRMLTPGQSAGQMTALEQPRIQQVTLTHELPTQVGFYIIRLLLFLYVHIRGVPPSRTSALVHTLTHARTHGCMDARTHGRTHALSTELPPDRPEPPLLEPLHGDQDARPGGRAHRPAVDEETGYPSILRDRGRRVRAAHHARERESPDKEEGQRRECPRRQWRLRRRLAPHPSQGAFVREPEDVIVTLLRRRQRGRRRRQQQR